MCLFLRFIFEFNAVFCWLFAIAVVIFVVVVVSRREIHKNLEVTRRAIVLVDDVVMWIFLGGFMFPESCLSGKVVVVVFVVVVVVVVVVVSLSAQARSG